MFLPLDCEHDPSVFSPGIEPALDTSFADVKNQVFSWDLLIILPHISNKMHPSCLNKKPTKKPPLPKTKKIFKLCENHLTIRGPESHDQFLWKIYYPSFQMPTPDRPSNHFLNTTDTKLSGRLESNLLKVIILHWNNPYCVVSLRAMSQ